MRRARRLAAAAALASVAAGAALAGVSAHAQDVGADEIEIADVLEVIVLAREVLAIDARGGGQTRAALDLGESVLWSGAKGRVGVVVTDRRLLAVGTRSAAWQEARWRRRETPAGDVLIGGRVALATTSERVFGFDGRSGNLVERSLGPQERVLRSEAGENVGVVITDRSALGVSSYAGGFFEARLRVGEEIEDLSALANVATVRTPRRILVFRAHGGRWEERSRDLR
jgi:hypothetical protein